MNVTDPLDRIRALAPAPEDPDAHEAVLAGVLADVAQDITPLRHRAASRRRRVVAATAAIVVLGAGGVAAAAGYTPRSTWDAIFTGPATPHGQQYEADPSTARKVFSEPGPDGQEFAAWTIDNRVGWQCVSAFFEPAGTTTLSPHLFGSLGGACALSPHHDSGLFGDGASGFTEGRNDRATFVYPAGPAVRAELVVSDGHTYPVRIQNGWLGGWFTLTQIPLGSTATVVAYGAHGTELGHRVVLDQSGCPDSAPC